MMLGSALVGRHWRNTPATDQILLQEGVRLLMSLQSSLLLLSLLLYSSALRCLLGCRMHWFIMPLDVAVFGWPRICGNGR